MLKIDLAILDFFDAISCKFLDYFFYFISEGGGTIAVIVIFGVTYWCIDKKIGEKLGFTMLLSICLNNTLKNLFNRKRPFELEGKEHLRKLDKYTYLSDHATGSSFPSGHSQNACTSFPSLAVYFKRKFLTIICIILPVLILISRVYLGVHYPSDVIVGGMVGLIITFLMYFLLGKFWKFKYIIYLVPVLVFMPLLFYFKEYDFFRGYGLLLGFVFGIFLENNYINFTNDISKKRKLLRFLVGMVAVGFVFIIINLIPKNISGNNLFGLFAYFLISFIGIGIIPFAFKSSRNPKGL